MKGKQVQAQLIIPQASSPIEKRAYSIEEAAEALGIGRNLALELVHDGRLRSVPVGKRILIPVVAIDEFLAPGVEHPPSPKRLRKKDPPTAA